MATARQLVDKLARSLEGRLRFNLINRITGAKQYGGRILNPRMQDVDWQKTIHANLRHYQPEAKTIIPVRLLGHPRSRKSAKEIVIVVDQSASMLESFVHAAVIASILASIPSIKTHLVVFDTEVVDLTEEIKDPVSLLFKGQLGGGTDIAKAIRYVRNLTRQRTNVHVLLISDLYEGGRLEILEEEVRSLLSGAVRMAVILALDDRGKPDFDHDVANSLASLGVSSLACPPEKFPGFIASFLNDEEWKLPSEPLLL
ncbi:MAG: VWA domain-containing protein, partial [Saprospiraceae bacterium]|nr:VWA domain-containing protein [Saprospiraceae bacterium]